MHDCQRVTVATSSHCPFKDPKSFSWFNSVSLHFEFDDGVTPVTFIFTMLGGEITNVLLTLD